MFKIKSLLCRLGFHRWSFNRGGVRICMWCPAVDRYYGISGFLRRQLDITTTYQRTSDAELREEWIKQEQQHYDLKYMVMAREAASSSTCAKKHLGCVLVLAKDDIVLSGSNGPPVGMKKCERKTVPLTWKKHTRTGPTGDDLIPDDEKHGCIPVEGCPRLDSHIGTDTQKCRAVHAERQVLLKAAHLGLSTDGSTLYSYMGVPCKDCLLELCQAGIAEIVVIKETYYDELSKSILKEWIDSGRKFRVVE